MNERDAFRCERKDRHETNASNSGQPCKARLELLVELKDGVTIRIAHLRQREFQAEDIRSIKARFFAVQTGEAAKQKSSVCQQDYSESNLTRYEPGAEPR